MNDEFDSHGRFSYKEAVQAWQSPNRIIPMVKSHIMTKYLYIHIGLGTMYERVWGSSSSWGTQCVVFHTFLIDALVSGHCIQVDRTMGCHLCMTYHN